mmetsp:Transcript_32180/g.81790  ORF Transcript_32180/g.81790 Transcript_32180/m.81790 type:complete len:476 (-) Transcript_32180:554-1981(-)|eukprot:CAMPEP_0202862700 /NCGR_PEP_ID=MMETSP1391-20130828/3647_1 /ASSEMBLY_ACC=CAM_ASM_000867 /TAXON_ID=1034604 /ORGANISM="Chlamydomonas leiostraca, Strain SAG 11-49" /LENGTH=475 /DNA_ID=CAMNT_0049542273 /DNA_START=135 /DNA_END=1562 /DNA_ORIENTATION=+
MGAGGAATQEAGSQGTFKGLVGHKNFVRNNPRSDRFPIHRFHHVEFWCSDATTTYKRFQTGLGMGLVAKSDLSTGNSCFASYALQSHELVFAFTAPYSRTVAGNSSPGAVPLPHYSHDTALSFIASHGLAVRAMGLVVEDAAHAFEESVKHGGVPVLPPTPLPAGSATPTHTIAEVKLYGDVVLRYISGDVTSQPYLAGYEAVQLPAGFHDRPQAGQHAGYSYGLKRLDHAVGNVHKLPEAINYVMGFTGFHEFAEFVADDVGTLDSGLNSVVLANNNEYVLLPINEPTFGTPRKSQIQTFLEQNEGPGLQHLALKTDDIFFTLREMRARSEWGGLEFMPKPSDKYYRELPQKADGALTEEQLKECEELGILVDKDDQGLLLQIFTKPLGDRPTVFIEIIQRVGCMREAAAAAAATGTSTDKPATVTTVSGEVPEEELKGAPACEMQAAGCGGFGKGNFSELFKRIEDYERTLNI